MHHWAVGMPYASSHGLVVSHMHMGVYVSQEEVTDDSRPSPYLEHMAAASNSYHPVLEEFCWAISAPV